MSRVSSVSARRELAPSYLVVLRVAAREPGTLVSRSIGRMVLCMVLSV